MPSNWAAAWAQKSHRGRSRGENRQANSTAPPTPPTTRKARSSPMVRRSRKRNTAIVLPQTQSRSTAPVSRGNRHRRGRSRS